MSKIIMIQKEQTYISISLMEHLKEREYEVSSVNAELNDIDSVVGQAKVLILYLDDAFVKDYTVMEYIREMLSDRNRVCFLVGDGNEIIDAEKIISRRRIAGEFKRPLNVMEVARSIDNILKQEPAQQKKKILVVDDSGAMLKNIKGWLGDKYEVILANSGEFALKYLSSNYPDLVLLDYEMPNMNGREVLETIRSDVRMKDLPVIFLTGKSEKKDVMEVMALKPEGYILKTEDPKKVEQRIDEFFCS